MSTIHCSFCGGVVTDPKKIEYRPPRMSAQVALATSEPCTCERAIVYEHLPIEPDEDEPRSLAP
jgi:hypothetical protein